MVVIHTEVGLEARDLDAYASIPIAFEVKEAFDPVGLAGRPDRRLMSVEPVARPWIKDYDSYRDNAPRDWGDSTSLRDWKFFAAMRDGRRVGSLALAPLTGRDDIAVIWDVRVAPTARRSGVGAALLRAAEEWAANNGKHWLMVETQNVNVPAYAFYLTRDFTLTQVRAGAYADLPDEVQMILHKKLAGPHRMPDEIVTPRLVLKRRRASDAPVLKALVDANLEHLRAWMPWAMKEPSTLEATRERLARFETLFDRGLEWPYGIWSRDTGAHLGAMGVHPRIGPEGLEIGYWLDQDATSHGYATEAADALTRVALEQPGVTHVQIRHDPRNIASAGIPRRLGFRHVLTIENETFAPDGSLRDTLVWEKR